MEVMIWITTGSCQDQLGMEDGRITDSQITASSEHHSGNLDYIYARLNQPAQSGIGGAWTAGTQDLNQWIQVEFESSKWMNGIIIQGRSNTNQWVTEYKVQYSIDGENWQYVMTVDDQDEQVWMDAFCT